jgi:hypothetical protein
MLDRIDRAIRTMNLRRKLRALEAKRKASVNFLEYLTEIPICIVLLPVILPVAVYAGFVWVYRKARRAKS